VSSAAEADGDSERGALGGFLLTLRSRGIRDGALLLAIERAPRAAFLPRNCAAFAYQDLAVPIACGQQATSPFVAAEALSHLDIGPQHRVLEIGTGSGWQTAVLARLAREVVTIERFETLHRAADASLAELGVDNALRLHGDGAAGHAARAPYDRIVFNAAIAALPPEVVRQAAPDAIIVAPLIGDGGQHLARRALSEGAWVRLSPSGFAEMRSGRALAS